ncbi:hypothetical protein Pyn_27315 [Prunus yedoensis var. nudiflora]|uniref:Uncharacterized protein n=1 Tax=Prunus yedoensis var. nudiflora TaxID=2094558 RepID=A0A314ZKN4_PRUYE|nr:hypothetical protein Pyn_27315 [Prunus yedoensis var. nudiflora]
MAFTHGPTEEDASSTSVAPSGTNWPPPSSDASGCCYSAVASCRRLEAHSQREHQRPSRLKLMADFAVSMYNLRTHKKLFIVRVIRDNLGEVVRCESCPRRHPNRRGPELSACRFGQGWTIIA